MISSNRFILLFAALMITAGAIYFAQKRNPHSPDRTALAKSPREGSRPDSAAESISEPKPLLQAAAPSPAVVAIQPSPAALSPQEREQLRVVDEVLSQSTDSDPRMDKELKVLSSAVRAELRSRYQQMAAEKRNSKGTVVFLLGRNLKEPRDLDFLKDVLNEPPCLSLTDCRRVPALTADDDHTAGLSIALAYPQLVALHSVSRLVEQDVKLANQPMMKKKIAEVVRAGLTSQIPDVVASARKVQRHLR